MKRPPEPEIRLLSSTIQYQVVSQIVQFAWVIILAVVVFMLAFFPAEELLFCAGGSFLFGIWMCVLRFCVFPKVSTTSQLDWLTFAILTPGWVLNLTSLSMAGPETHNLEYSMLLTIASSLMFFQRKNFVVWLVVSTLSYIAVRLSTGQPIAANNWLFLLLLSPWMTVAIRKTVNNCFRGLHIQEDEKKQLIVELKTRQDQLTAILNQAPLILCVIGSDGRYLHSRGSGLCSLSLQQNEIVGMHYDEVFKDFPQIREAISNARGGKPSQVRAQFGEGVLYEISYDAIYDGEGKLTEVIGVGINVSESVRADNHEKQYLKELYHSQKVESLETLAGGVAHDFNNYLMAIVGFCESIESSDEASPKNQKVISLIKDTAMQAAGVSNQMLVYAGKNNHLPDEERTEIELGAFLAGNQSFLSALVDKNVMVRVADNVPGESEFWVKADRGLIQQALVNIVKNANDSYARELGTIDVRVEPFEFPIDENIRIFGDLDPDFHYGQIVTSDFGCGIADEDLDRVFDIYFTTKSTGNGIGLAVTASIMKSHGGAILCESIVGQGTTSRLVFPLVRCRENSNIEEQFQGHGTQTLTHRVVVIDDEKIVNDSIALMLEAMNCETYQFMSGIDAIERIDELKDYDCVLIDYSMPGLNGLETLQRFRDGGLEVPIILMSGFSLAFHGNNDCKHQPTGTLEKPFPLNGLLEKIEEVTRDKSAQA